MTNPASATTAVAPRNIIQQLSRLYTSIRKDYDELQKNNRNLLHELQQRDIEFEKLKRTIEAEEAKQVPPPDTPPTRPNSPNSPNHPEGTATDSGPTRYPDLLPATDATPTDEVPRVATECTQKPHDMAMNGGQSATCEEDSESDSDGYSSDEALGWKWDEESSRLNNLNVEDD